MKMYQAVSLPPLEVQVQMAEEYGTDTLLICPDAWALRHRFVNRETGEVVRARCNSWSCLYCGPRKVDLWRQLVKAAEPTLFVTLTRVGKTVEEAARVLTTVLQYLRRGSKGRGKQRRGSRPAYPIQVFAVLEQHKDIEHVGFHWHLLVKGVDYLPKSVVSDALRSATQGKMDSYVVDVRRVKKQTAVGYVTKYLMKEVHREHRGMVEERRVVARVAQVAVVGSEDSRGVVTEYRVCLDEAGAAVEQQEVQVVQRLCKAHRIRYSKDFFPASTAEMRRRLFGETTSETTTEQPAAGVAESTTDEQEAQRSGWMLQEVEPVGEAAAEQERRRHAALLSRQEQEEEADEEEKEEREAGEEPLRVQAYWRMRRQAVREALVELRGGKRQFSRRIVTLWSYQRNHLRLAG